MANKSHNFCEIGHVLIDWFKHSIKRYLATEHMNGDVRILFRVNVLFYIYIPLFFLMQ